MSNLFDNEPIPRRTMVLFFVIDCSGSMSSDGKMGAVNAAISEVLNDLKAISKENADAQIKIAPLKFSTGAEWMCGESPFEAEYFEANGWTPLKASGVTDFGEACRMLNEKLSRNAFMRDTVGNYAPVIVLLSDGAPTDNYKNQLAALKDNKWFTSSTRIAIAIGEDAKMDVLAEFTDNPEAVFFAPTAEELKKMIRVVSVRASQIGSKSSSVGIESKSKQEETVEAIKEGLDNVQTYADIQSEMDSFQ